jgi:hypothetical protein
MRKGFVCGENIEYASCREDETWVSGVMPKPSRDRKPSSEQDDDIKRTDKH